MTKELKYQPAVAGGTILKGSENLDGIADKDIFARFKLPPLRYPKLKKARVRFETISCGKKTLSSHCVPRDHIFTIPNEYGKVGGMMRDSQSPERNITADEMKSIDQAITKFSRTPSINSNQLIEDLQNETWQYKKKLPYMTENASSEAIAMKHLCNIVLNNEQTFAKGLDKTIENNDMLNLRRREVRFKKWQEDVYVPVTKAVSATVDREYREFRRKKQRLYRDYLTLTNRKVVSYLDYEAEDYDGNRVYGPNGFGHRMRARTGHIHDPVLSSITRRDHEDRTLIRCDKGHTPTEHELVRSRYPIPTLPFVPLGRSHPPADPNSWLMMKFSDINANSCTCVPKQFRQRYDKLKQLHSTVDLSHQPARMTREEVAQELAIPVRRRFVELMNRSANIEKLITMSNAAPSHKEEEEQVEGQDC